MQCGMVTVLHFVTVCILVSGVSVLRSAELCLWKYKQTVNCGTVSVVLRDTLCSRIWC